MTTTKTKKKSNLSPLKDVIQSSGDVKLSDKQTSDVLEFIKQRILNGEEIEDVLGEFGIVTEE